MSLLLAGGHEDFNLTVLAEAAQRAKIEYLDLRLPAKESPAFCWKPGESAPRYMDRTVAATSAFIRYDAFSGVNDPRPEVPARAMGWYQTLMGWLLSEPRIRLFNRGISLAATIKPTTLIFAHEAGLRIPHTWITNETTQFAGDRVENMIAKPVAGGDYCYSLADALAKTSLRGGLAAMPAVVQKRLVAPEVRLYIIGKASFAFEVRSSSLDYRVNQDAALILLPEVPQEVCLLRKLMTKLGLDFGAADFKTDPDTGELVFLEVNTSPMFARFDQVSGGLLSAAIIEELTAA